ncbi:response regulator [Iodobacter sp. LRB]|uniref:response regulator transcription factor n=1 Tax=unclassified Iodobacter TaxID=235634 RepID=UPI000C0F3535|nr:response regulator [Iodobacter sp. BJB302]PHU99989.1 DNA-binding response regulator [Iodobacter sp. BJB302]
MLPDRPAVFGPLSDKPHILIVDDSVDELRFLLDALRSRNYRLSVAFDGQQGYQRAQASPPDLILMDVNMPRVDGYASCRLLKANPQLMHIPVLFLSASNTVNDRLLGFSSGAVDFICKPFAAEEVIARVGVHLELALRRSNAAEPVPELKTPEQDEVLLAAAVQIIGEQLYRPLTLADIASQIGTYEKKLSKIFKTHMGMTVFTYIREQKLQNARQLLAKTQMSVIDIAEQLGFQSACNFTTAFKEHFSQTPSAFRQTIKLAGAHA